MKKVLAVCLILCITVGGVFAAGQKEDEVVTLKILTDMNPDDDMNTNALTAEVERITGFDLEFEKLPDDPIQRAQKINLILASELEYDLIRLSSLEIAKELIPKGYFHELDGLLEEYGSNIIKNTAAKWFEPVQWEGGTYAIPIKRTAEASIVGSMYRKDTFDAFGLEIPQTPSEFKEALTVIKQKQGGIPYTAASAFPIIDTISSAFGICQNVWYDVDGTLVNRVKMPGFIEYVAFIQNLIDEGLLDPEFAANTDQMTQTKFASGKATASFWAWWWWPSNNAIRQNEGAELAFLPPLRSEDGESITWLWGNTPEWATVIPRASKHAKEAVQFLDALSKNENFEKIFMGTEGVHYEIEDGLYEATATYTEEKGNSWIMLMTSNDTYQLPYQQIGQSGEDPDQDVLFTYQGLKDAAGASAVADPTGNLAPPAENGLYAGSLASLERDFILAVVSGARKLSEYDVFIKQWEKDGGAVLEQKWNEIYQAR
jgi:putative aldouronate transport system substrate-binding protein